MKTVVVGTGILGASIAFRLARAGADVLAIGGAGGATDCSFGWINASFFLDADHFRLRAEGMEAWRRLGDVPGLDWQGAVSWEHDAGGLEAQAAELQGYGYRVERLGANALRDRVPALSVAPEMALAFPDEGPVEPSQAASALLSRAEDAGARLMIGARVEAVTERAGRVIGVRTTWGDVAADAVIVAAGGGAPALVEPLGVALPMLTRPGAMMVSRPVPRVTDTILVAPSREIRQDATGRILAPGAVSHQGDAAEALDLPPERMADRAKGAVEALFPGLSLDWQRIAIAHRPMPGDGRPVIGRAGPEGLHLAVMHSGVTLAAMTGEAVADMVTGGDRFAALVSPYDPLRFAP
jgi:glycine/D-amino acid oxidase-like deaminating enzyme